MFSLNYVLAQANTIIRTRGLATIGCCYTYDDAINGVLYDERLVSMKYIEGDSTKAIVRWDHDTYEEPVVAKPMLTEAGFNSIVVKYPTHPLHKHLVIARNQ